MKYIKTFESYYNKSKNRTWKINKNGKHEYSDLFFVYDLPKSELGNYLNVWFDGVKTYKKDVLLMDEVVTLKKTDKETSDSLYRRKYNPVSITIKKPYTKKDNTDYNMSAVIHSIDDSSFGIWWSNYYGTQKPLPELYTIREKIMEYVSYRPELNGEDFLNYCVELGASEESKDYN